MKNIWTEIPDYFKNKKYSDQAILRLVENKSYWASKRYDWVEPEDFIDDILVKLYQHFELLWYVPNWTYIHRFIGFKILHIQRREAMRIRRERKYCDWLEKVWTIPEVDLYSENIKWIMDIVKWLNIHTIHKEQLLKVIKKVLDWDKDSLVPLWKDKTYTNRLEQVKMLKKLIIQYAESHNLTYLPIEKWKNL